MWARIRKVAAEFDAEYANGNFTPHVLRHTFITRLFEAGLDIKEIQSLAGHKDVAVTLAIYTHFDKKSRQADTFQAVRDISRRRSTDQGVNKVVDFPASGRRATGGAKASFGG